MDAASFDPTTTFKLTDFNGAIVPATISASSDLKTFTLTPSAALTGGGKTYTVTISSSDGFGRQQPKRILNYYFHDAVKLR